MGDIWEVWSKQYVFFAPQSWWFDGIRSSPIAIVFEDVPNRKNNPTIRPMMKAWAIEKDGTKRAACNPEISPILGSRMGRCFDVGAIVGIGAKGEPGLPGSGVFVSKMKFLLWLLGAETDTYREEEMQFQLDYFLPLIPPTPGYFHHMQNRLNFSFDCRFGIPLCCRERAQEGKKPCPLPRLKTRRGN